MPGSPLRKDVAKYYAIVLGGDTRLSRRLAFWLLNRDFHCVLAYRFGRWAAEKRARGPLGYLPVLLHHLWSRWNSTIHHVNIDRRARIGPGFLLMHRNGVTIGPCQVGANAVIHHNVTIGERVARADHGVPKLGANVWVGPGVIVTGAICIGDGVTLSGGCVLSKSVPARSLVAGNPGRVINADYDNSELINYVLPPDS